MSKCPLYDGLMRKVPGVFTCPKNLLDNAGSIQRVRVLIHSACTYTHMMELECQSRRKQWRPPTIVRIQALKA